LKRRILVIFVTFLVLRVGIVRCQEVWTDKDFLVLEIPANQMMETHLTHIIDIQFLEREKLLRSLTTPKDWKRHIDNIRNFFVRSTGSLPKRTPLNARITGQIEREDYRVEKILFESRPNFLVSANLYLPRNHKSPRPAVLNVIGHYPNGKSAEHIQRRCIGQAKKGLIAFAIDGLGQGDRQILDYSKEFKARPLASNMPGGVHKSIGLQAFLSGTHSFNFMVWDIIRAIDYLETRPEVDSEEIAITGTSGGGMMSTYILPFEDRIKVAIPACNPNTYSYHVHLPSGSDHENVFFGSFAESIDMRGDPLFTHAPKPLLINATTDDQLNPPRGTWKLASWLFRAYSSFGEPEKFQTSMIDGPHGYSRKQREVANAWMLKWMGEDPSNFTEDEFPIESEGDLLCAPGGDIYQIPNSREPHTLVTEHLEENRANWDRVENHSDLEKLRDRLNPLIEKVLALGEKLHSPIFDTQEPKSIDNKKMTSVVLRPEQGILLPGIFIENDAPYPNPKIENPADINLIWQRKKSRFEPWIETKETYSSGPVILYLNDKGKQALIDDNGLVTSLLTRGYRILAIDVRGTGETSPGRESWHLDYLAGKPILGQRVTDIQACILWLQRPEVMAKGLYIWANGVRSLEAAFAASQIDGISGLILEQSLLSFESAVSVRLPEYGDEILLPAILELFDTPQLYQSLAPTRVAIINPLLGDKQQANELEVKEAYRNVSRCYESVAASGQWSVHPRINPGTRSEIILGILNGQE